VSDIDAGTSSRLTFSPAQHNTSPVWSPDDTRIAFSAFRNGTWGIYQKAASGVGTEQALFESKSAVTLTDWVGDVIVFTMNDPNLGGSSIWSLTTSGDHKPVPFQPGQVQTSGQLSTDGRWLAYASPESGKFNIYVQSFPTPGSKYQVSTEGGVQPRWRRDGHELLFVSASRNNDVMAVRVDGAGDGLKFSPPIRLLTTGFLGYGHVGGQEYSAFALTADGRRLVTPIPRATGVDLQYPLTVVLNWAPSSAAHSN
jgi:Tol biopolymer transport system component